jgi:hypothetical protein
MSFFKKNAPAITLMAMAPLLTEVLPGATRFSSIFVFPIEMCVWGGGCLLIRAAVRKWQLGWINMLLLAIALSIAEECIIQQTSLAPMVIRLKGITYARSFGVNYVYFLWALIYEPVFVVLLPVYLVELIFPERKEETWLSKAGLIVVSIFFVLGSYLAWFSWTQIARPKVFHIPAYNPPKTAVLIAALVMLGLIFTALRSELTSHSKPLRPFNPWLLGIAGALWATALYGIVVLGFGAAPAFPPLAAIAIGVLLIIIAILLVPRFTADIIWQSDYTYGLIFGIMIGSMLVSFIGFWGPPTPDLYFKIIVNILAVILMIRLGLKVKQRLLCNS